MATHSSILAWKIPWTEEPGRLQSMGLQRPEHDLVTKQHNLIITSAVHGVAKSRTGLSNFTFTFHCHALEKEMVAHSSVLVPGEFQGRGTWWGAVSGVARSRTRLE